MMARKRRSPSKRSNGPSNKRNQESTQRWTKAQLRLQSESAQQLDDIAEDGSDSLRDSFQGDEDADEYSISELSVDPHSAAAASLTVSGRDFAASDESDDPLLPVEKMSSVGRSMSLLQAGIVTTVAAVALLFASELSTPLYRNTLSIAGAIMAVLTVVITYVAGGASVYPGQFRIWQPLRGGIRFIVLQIIGWTMFGFSVLLSTLPWILGALFPGFAFRGLMLSGGVAAIMAEVAIVASLLLFRHRETARSSILSFLIYSRDTKWWSWFLAVQLLLAFLSVALAALADAHEFKHSGSLFFVASAALACSTISLFLTYGLGGKWRHGTRHWKFYQPLEGGIVFIVLQAIAWTMFGCSSFLFLLHLDKILSENLGMTGLLAFVPVRRQNLVSLSFTATLAAVAEVLNAISLAFYSRAKIPPSPSKEARPTLTHIVESAIRLLAIVILYNLEKVIITFFIMSLLAARHVPYLVVTTWILMGVAYVPSYFGQPEMTGRRTKTGWRESWIVNQMASYFRYQLIVHHAKGDASAEEVAEAYRRDGRRYIMGYHPHGIVPLWCGMSSFTRQWREKLSTLTPATLTSSIVHFVPLLRDMTQFLGGIEVSRQGFVAGLRRMGSVILVPGGQSEMIESRSEMETVVVKTHHKGFVRLAMEIAGMDPEHEHFLVPVFSFGETKIFDNVRAPKSIQEFCTKTLKANVIYAPYGRWNLVGVPRPAKVVVVVGTPIKVPPTLNPTDEQIDVLHRRYFTHLHEIVDANRRKAGYPETELELFPRVDPLSADDFEDEFERQPKNFSKAKPKWKHYSNHREQVWMGLLMSVLFWTVVWRALT